MSTATVDAMLAEVDALSAAATPGPWDAVRRHNDGRDQWSLSPAETPVASQAFLSADLGTCWIAHTPNRHGRNPWHVANARFIARARTLLPELAAVVREHREESRRARERIGVLVMMLESIAGTFESAVRHAESKGQGGQHVPFHGDFAQVPPSAVGRMRWWAREMRTVLSGERGIGEALYEEAADLRADNARMREALEAAAPLVQSLTEDECYLVDDPDTLATLALVRAALEGGKP